MVDRKWMPSEYMDEIVPPARQAPSDWIVTVPGDAFALAPAWDDDEPTLILRPGQIVYFDWTEIYSPITIDIAADGTFTCRDLPDPRASCVWIAGDGETIDESVASFAENWISNGAPPGTVKLEQYAWSAKSEQYRFELAPDGPRFVLLTENTTVVEA